MKWWRWLVGARVLIWLVIIGLIVSGKISFADSSAKVRRRAGKIVTSLRLLPEPHQKIDVPFHRQERALSCEVASLRSALLTKGIDVKEAELFELLPKDPTPKTAGVWGDPDRGFVGDVDGSQERLSGYGVYAGPLAELARTYGDRVTAGTGFTSEDVAREIAAGNPVIIWGITGRFPPKDISWQTSEGKHVPAFVGEHSRVVYGYVGEVDQPYGFFLMDPIYGRLFYSRDRFEAQWAYFNNQAVIIR